MDLYRLFGFVRTSSPLKTSLYKIITPILMFSSAFSSQASPLGFVEFEGDRNNDTSPGYFTQEVVESPDGRFVYSISNVNQRLNAYMRDNDTGMIDLIQSVQNPDPAIGDYGLRSVDGMAISPDGQYIYVTGLNNDPFDASISWFERDSDTGMLTYAGKILQDVDIPSGYGNPNGELRISADGFFLYAGDDGSNGQILVFSRANNGVIQHVETVSNGGDLNGLNRYTISPDGNNLYAVSGMPGSISNSNALVVFNRNPTTGQLTHSQTFSDVTVDSANGIAGLLASEDVIVSSDGRFVYTVGLIENDTSTTGDNEYTVLTFQRDTNDGTLQFVTSTTNTTTYNTNSDWDTLWWSTSLAFSVDSEQKFLYVGAQIADSINVFRRNSQDGSLNWVGWETEGENGVTNLESVQNIIVSNDGRHIYAALDQGDGITVFDTRADLSLVKTDSADPVDTGESLTYTLAVTNNGPSDAQNVIVTDRLPSGMTFVNATVNAPGTSCSHNAGTVSCDFGNVVDAASINAMIEVSAPNTAGTITNAASVTADQLDTNTANNSDSEDTCVEDPATPTCSGISNSPSSPPPTTGGGGSISPMWMLMLASIFILFRHAGNRVHRNTDANYNR